MIKSEIKTINFKDMHAESMKDPEFKKNWDDLEVEFQIINALILQRSKMKMTQKQLAKKIGTDQATLSRLESGKLNPSIEFLKRVAKALDKKLEVSFV